MSQGKLPSHQGYTTGLLLDESAINSRLRVDFSLGTASSPLNHQGNVMFTSVLRYLFKNKNTCPALRSFSADSPCTGEEADKGLGW